MKKALIPLGIIILLMIIQHVFDDTMGFGIKDEEISSFDDNRVMSKLQSKLNVEDISEVFILGSFDSRENQFTSEEGFQLTILSDGSWRVLSNIAVANDNGSYDIFLIIKSKGRIEIIKTGENEIIDHGEVTLRDAFQIIVKTDWPSVLDKLEVVDHYTFTISPNYTGMTEILEKDLDVTYVVSDQLMESLSDYASEDFDAKYFEMKVDYYTDQGVGRKSNMILLFKE